MKPIRTVYGNYGYKPLVIFVKDANGWAEYMTAGQGYNYVGKVRVTTHWEDIRYFCDDDLYFVTEVYGEFPSVTEALEFVKSADVSDMYIYIESVTALPGD